jgi:tetratricopeptide (TPR) repeat protein
MIGELRTSHLFTSERLFGDVATSGLSRHAIFLERAKAETGRDEAAVRFALAAYVVVRLTDTYLCVDRHDVTDREGLLWQHRAVRRHMDELPADHTETSHLLGIVDAMSVEVDSITTLRVSLTAYAYFLEHEGRFGEALELVALATRSHGDAIPVADFAACALFAARLNRRLAHWDDALACYGAAYEAAETIGDNVLRLRSCLGRGAVCRGQGNLPLAQTIAEEVLAEATDLQLVEMQLGAYADLSAVYTSQGKKLDALRADYQAFQLAPDATARMRTLGDLGVSFLDIGAHDAARLAFEIVLKSNVSFWVRNNALLEMMDLESILGNRVAFERLRMSAEAERARMAPSMVADFLRKSGMGFARFGQVGRSREVLNAGLAFAETHRLNAWYFKIEAALRELDAVPEPKPTAQPTFRPERVDVIQEMEAGLREYAALQPA